MKPDALRDAFLGWQCRIRQIIVRQQQGRPGSGMIAAVSAIKPENAAPLCDIVTVLNKKPEHELTAEFRHIYRKTHDPGERAKSALELLSECYYQRYHEFSDELTATFSHDSLTKDKLRGQRYFMRYRQFTQGFDLACDIVQLDKDDPSYQATFWHNLLFNPSLPASTVILAFRPDWSQSSVLDQ